MYSLNMKIVILLCSFLAIQLVAGQCGQKLNDAKKCMKDIRKARKDDKPDIDKDKLKEDIKACFTKSGCKDPTGDDDDDNEEGGPSSIMTKRIIWKMEKFGFKFNGVTDENLASFIESAKECGKKVKDTVKPEVEKCIQGKDDQLSDFTFPDQDDEDGDDDDDPREGIKSLMKFMRGKKGYGKGGRKGRHGGGKMLKRAKRLVHSVYDESICPKDKRNGARQCIEGVIDNIIPADMKCKNPIQMMFEKADKHEEFCDGHKKCLADLGDDCTEVKEKLPGYVCECAADQLKDSVEELLNQFKECINEQSGIAIEEPGRLFKKALGRIGKGAMRGMCEREGRMRHHDPCDPDSQGKWGHRGHRGRGGEEERGHGWRGRWRGHGGNGRGRGWGWGNRGSGRDF